MNSELQHAQAVAIIGGADGPTGVFVGSKAKKPPLKIRLRTFLYQQRRRKAAKKITAGAHTIEQLLAYAESTYGAALAECDLHKHSAVCRVYQIKTGCDCMHIEIDDMSNTFGVSFSGNKKAMKYFQTIAKDLYTYYGVSEEDICQKSQRYMSLLSVLSM